MNRKDAKNANGNSYKEARKPGEKGKFKMGNTQTLR